MNKTYIENAYLGIELGSTRIKAILIDDTYTPIASGSFHWENTFENGYWTYSLENIHTGIRECYKNLVENIFEKYGIIPETFGSIGISAMMHGYLPFDKNGVLLTPFRTWRNTTTEIASQKLTELFRFNIPQRFSISHLYQAILNGEKHVKDISILTTLSGYIYYMLTGKYEIGIGDASGIFPVENGDYNMEMVDKFDKITQHSRFNRSIRDVLPKVKLAGKPGALLTSEGAKFLDPSGKLKPGISICPPEGDAGTGMVATNSVTPKSGNVSAGTSVFSMLVLDKPLNNVYSEIDMITTPDGLPVAMVHCNNCCNELDTWVNIFAEFAKLMNVSADVGTIYEKLYTHALTSENQGTVSYNYLSGEHITHIPKGRPMYFRMPEKKMNLADFMKSQLYSTFATLSMGMDILFKKEKVCAKIFSAHGGLFTVKNVAQQILASVFETPVSVMETSGEGGAWGMAIIAAYMKKGSGKPLGKWLEEEVFANMKITTINPIPQQTEDFAQYMKLYNQGLKAEMKLSEID